MQQKNWKVRRSVMSPVNTDELEVALMMARQRVLKIQTKLHRWAVDDPLIAGSTICSTSSPIPPSFWWRGIG